MKIELTEEEALIVVTTLQFVAKIHVDKATEKSDLAGELLRINQKILEQVGDNAYNNMGMGRNDDEKN